MARGQLRILPLVALAGLLVAAGCSATASDDFDTSEARISNAVTDSEGNKVLPNWATADELSVEQSTPAPATPRASFAPLTGYRVPAQFEPVQAVVMTWAGYPDTLKGISVAAAAAGAQVWMVGGPSSIAGVPADHYKALPFGYNSIWARDYGPVGINEATNSLGIVDTTYRHHAVRRDDDAVSCRLANELGAECHPTNLILDGGNFMTDGRGNAFLTKRIYDWNSSMSKAEVDDLLKQYLGASTIHTIDYAKDASGQPADGTGHMDMFAKIIADCKVVVVQTPNEPYKTTTDKAAAYFASLSCGEGTYQVHRVKGWVSGRTWYTYSNALMVNKSIILPSYDNRAAENAEAIETYKRLLPGYTVVGVNTEELIRLGGSIHCITKDIPAVVAR
jgi:agmatine deiminase